MLDGRHTGTGGGNHIVLGGMTPADSPFLRRPDLLASLSPTGRTTRRCRTCSPACSSARPARRRASTKPATTASTNSKSPWRRSRDPAWAQIPPWLVDRLFRNLLIDVTGNTHRAEICIDKLYSPDGPTGRLGLVEFRSFEMPPHARMSLAQQLLLRALIAWFWERALSSASSIRWGTALHDRFMLPHFVWADFIDVIDDLQDARLAVSSSTGSAPHFEFRFPRCGAGQHAGRQARTSGRRWSPGMCWARKASLGGTARYVDSSLERFEVRCRGLPGDRYVVTCNGYACR